MVEDGFRSHVVDAAGDGSRLRDFIAERLGCSKRRAKALLDARRVFVNRRRIWMAQHRLRKGDLVEFDAGTDSAARQAKGGPEIVHREPGMLIAVKPAAMLTQGRGSLERRLRKGLNEPSLEAVHRLDRDTSGLVIFSLDPRVREQLIDQFRQRDLLKEYLAIVVGSPPPDLSKIEKRIDGKSATTHLRPLDCGRGVSLLECRIESGRTHQIRIHLAALGCPVLGDKKYGSKKLADRRLRRVPRQMLHAYRLGLRSPATGELLDIRKAPPADFMRVLKEFGLKYPDLQARTPKNPRA